MTLQFYTPDTLPAQTELHLREHKVRLDDWDYLIIAPLSAVKWGTDRAFTTATYDDRSEVSRLLTGCCDNVWYRTPLWSVGVAYHS